MWSTRDGSSPNLDMYVNDHSASFYERNGMNPPRLISRSTRRQLQSKDNDEGTDNKSISDVDLIIEEAKLGNDALSRLRRDLVGDAYYDKHAYPFDYAWYGQKEGSRTGVPIELDINFHRVFSVDTILPVLDLVVWFRLEWADPRLTWDPQEYGNMTKVWFWIADGGGGGETSEIWTPDIQLWNLESELSDTLGDSYAAVSNDGSIYWTRPGHLRPSCKFYGLSNFPFDKLTCTMEFGSWAHSGKYMRLVMGGVDGVGFFFRGIGHGWIKFQRVCFCERRSYQLRRGRLSTIPNFSGGGLARFIVQRYHRKVVAAIRSRLHIVANYAQHCWLFRILATTFLWRADGALHHLNVGGSCFGFGDCIQSPSSR